jgi:RNA polymerase sigma-70 factor (ECF subfamily)
MNENLNCPQCPPFDCAARVQRHLVGDRLAFAELYERFRPLVWAIVTRTLGPQRSDDWEDASQAVFERLLEKINRWQQGCPFCKWLAVVAGRRAIDFVRQRRHFQSLENDPPAPRPKHEPLEQEEIECIHKRLAGFSEDWRQLWQLYLERVPMTEIAQRLGKSRRTIYNWLAEIQEQLSQCVKDRGIGPPRRR